MKLSLLVMTPGKSEGKAIPITLSQFLIGRDPQCQLRPASAVISKRHCAILLRGEKAFVRDFDSTNGTFVNDEQVKGEREILNNDRLRVGPLLFTVRLEATPPVTRPTPAPPVRAAAGSADDEDAAALLLSLQDDTPGSGGGADVDSQGVPTGSTVMEIMTPALPGDPNAPKPDAKKDDAKKVPSSASTSSAAKAILEKYMRRPRG